MKVLLVASLLVLNAVAQAEAQTSKPAGQAGAQPARPDRTRPDRIDAGDAKIDGQWIVVYMEKDGKKGDTGTNESVTIRNNVASWTEGGKEHRMRLQFGPMQTITSYPDEGTSGSTERTRRSTDTTETDRVADLGRDSKDDRTARGGDRREAADDRKEEGTHRGVYILSNEYLCISMNDMAASRDTGGRRATDSGVRPAGNTPREAGQAADRGSSVRGQPQTASFVLILKRSGSSNSEIKK
jgi:hypothetical protein